MKALRLVAIGVVLLLIAVAAAFVLRKEIADLLITRSLANAGLREPSVNIDRLELNEIVLSDISGGAVDGPAVRIKRLEADFNWRALLQERRLAALRIDGADVQIEIAENGDLRLPIEIKGGQGSAAQAPEIGRIELSNATVRASTPEGDLLLNGSGRLDADGGGEFAADLVAERAQIGGIRAAGMKGALRANFSADGQMAVVGALSGDAMIADARIDEIELSVTGSGAPWRDALAGDYAALHGDLQIELRSASIPLETISSLSRLSNDQLSSLGGNIEAVSANGVFNIAFSPGELTVSLPAEAPSIMTNRGDRLSVSAGQGPLYQRKDDLESIAARFQLDGAARGSLALEGARRGVEPWRITATSRLQDQTMFGAEMADAQISFAGDYISGRALGEVKAAIDFERINVGRLNVRGAPTTLSAPFRLDVENSFMHLGDASGGCVDVKRAAFALVDQPLNGSVNGSNLCARGGPLLEVTWQGGQPHAVLAGRLTAASGMVRFGETSFRGEPPKIDLTARYEPETQSTTVDGVYAGGNVIVNEALRFSGSRGLLQGALIGDALGADIRLDDALISAFSETPLFSPVKGIGVAKLKDDVFSFDYEIDTTNALALGQGDGVHNVKSGVGNSVFRTQTLRFLPDGLQPETLTPLLRGPISNATGAIDAVFNFDWDKSGLRTGGDIDFQDVTFRGPGLAVSQTANINGVLSLTSLLPVITNGEQLLRIGIVDLNALKLENGEVRFALPGDETLEIIKAEFPWFDGVIGAYETSTPLSGGDAKTVLRASGVDLGALLAFLEVDGLSGEGEIEGSLPITFDGGRARVTQGALSASGPGVIRYTGNAAAAAEASGSAAAAFQVLRELRFNKLTVGVDGPLDGTLKFSIYIEGFGDFPFETGNVKQTVNAPITYRISLNAPLLALIQQARMTADFQLQQSQINGPPDEGSTEKQSD